MFSHLNKSHQTAQLEHQEAPSYKSGAWRGSDSPGGETDLGRNPCSTHLEDPYVGE